MNTDKKLNISDVKTNMSVDIIIRRIVSSILFVIILNL